MTSYRQVAAAAESQLIKSIPTNSTRINQVQLDALVVLKIIKHAENEQRAGEAAQGFLTGMVAVEERRLEVTNCFPMAKTSDGDDEETMASHQQEILKKYRHINYDYLLVGFYQSAPFGACFTETFVESMFDYQSCVEDSVVLVYDPVKTLQGVLTLKAYRLSAEAMKLCYKDFSPESIRRTGLTYQNLFEELPVTVLNSRLVNIFLCELQLARKTTPSAAPKMHFLDLGSGGSLERSMRQLMSQLDSLNQEVNKYNRFQIAKQKQEAMKENYLSKRRGENEMRLARGEPALPDEDLNKLFKPPQIPSMLDGLLASAEVRAHADHTIQMAAQNLGKLFLAESVVDDKREKTG